MGVIVGTVTTLLPLLAPHLCALTRPLSRTHEERTTMLMTFLMLFGHSMGSLIAINYTALGKLGFYTSAGQQVDSPLCLLADCPHDCPLIALRLPSDCPPIALRLPSDCPLIAPPMAP